MQSMKTGLEKFYQGLEIRHVGLDLDGIHPGAPQRLTQRRGAPIGDLKKQAAGFGIAGVEF